MLPLKNSMGSYPPILANAVLSSTLKRGSSIHFTTTSSKVNNDSSKNDDLGTSTLSRSRSCLAVPSIPQTPLARSISTTETTRETAACFLSRLRTAQNTVDMTMFKGKRVPDHLIKPMPKPRASKSALGTIGQILCPKPDEHDLEVFTDDRSSVKNLGYALKYETAYETHKGASSKLSRLLNEPTGRSIPSDASRRAGVKEVGLSTEFQEEVRSLVSEAFASTKKTLLERNDRASRKLDNFDSLGSMLALNSNYSHCPVLITEGYSIDSLPLFKEEATCVLPSEIVPETGLTPGKPSSGSSDFKPHAKNLERESEELISEEVVLPDTPLDSAHNFEPETRFESPVNLEETRSVEPLNKVDAILAGTPSDAVWKTVKPEECCKVFKESAPELASQLVFSTKVKPRPSMVAAEDDSKIHITETPPGRTPQTYPNSILSIIDSPNRTGVFIQTDLYITNHIMDELKKDKTPAPEKSPAVPKLEAISLLEDDSNLIERHEEFLSLEDSSLFSEKLSVFPKSSVPPPPPPRHSLKSRTMSSSKEPPSPPIARKPPNVDVNVETTIKCVRDRTHSQLSVTEHQKYVDSRLPYPFCTESNLHITGSNEALIPSINAVEAAKSKLVLNGKSNETSSTIRGNVHLNHMLSDIPETTQGDQAKKNKKPTKTVPIHSVNSPKNPPINTDLSPSVLQAKIKQVLEKNPPKKLFTEPEAHSAFRDDGIHALTTRMMQKMFGGDAPKVKSKSKFVIKPPKSSASSPVPFKGFPKRTIKGLEEKIDSEKWEVTGVNENIIEMVSGERKKLVHLVDSHKTGGAALKIGETDGSLNARDKQILRKIIRQRLQVSRTKPKELSRTDPNAKRESFPVTHTSGAPQVDRFISPPGKQASSPPPTSTKSPAALLSQLTNEQPLKSSHSAEDYETEIIVIKNDNPAAKPAPKPSNREIIYIINDANGAEEPPKTPLSQETKINNENPEPEKCSSQSLDSKKQQVVVKTEKSIPNLASPVENHLSVSRNKQPEFKMKETILEKGSNEKEKSKNLIDVIKETSTGETSIGRVPDLGTLVPENPKNPKRKKIPVDESVPNNNFKPAGMFMGSSVQKARPPPPSHLPPPSSDRSSSSSPAAVTAKGIVQMTKLSVDSIQAPAVTIGAPQVPLQKLVDFPLMNAAKSDSVAREMKATILSINVHKDPELRLKLSSVPSVTKVLNATMPEKSRLALLKWRKNMVAQLGEEGFLKYYAEQLQKGADFHAAVQRYLLKKHDSQDSVGDIALDESNLPLQSLADVLKDVSDVRVLESHVFHPKLQYRGVIDCVAKYRDKPVLIEWKRSEKPKPTVKHTYDAPIQLSAYIGALNFDDNYPVQVSGGLVVVAYGDGSLADTYQISLSECNKYWKMWLERLKEFLRTKSEGENN